MIAEPPKPDAETAATSVKIVAPDNLAPADWEAWVALQQATPSLASPYFRPEFTQAVAAVRDDVEIAVLSRDNRTVGFFPFQRGGFGAGKPVGGRLSDFHGVVSAPDLRIDAGEFLRACRLSHWDFDHLPTSQPLFISEESICEQSRYIDLTDGYEAWLENRMQSVPKDFKNLTRRIRKAEREVGPVRLELRTTDHAAFDTLLEWKSAQYSETGVFNVFQHDWTVNLLKRILEFSGEEFEGWLSSLYIEDSLVAVHMGFRSHDVLHYWFPAYSHEFAQCSPGLILLQEITRSAAELGIKRIDLGRGGERFKLSFGSDAVEVAEGSLEANSLGGNMRRGMRAAKSWIKGSHFAGAARVPARLIRPIREWMAFK